MHEFSIAQALFEAAEREARRHRAGRITRIRCRVGVLQMIVPELLAEAFECLVAPSPHAGAELVVQKVPTTVTCRACGRRSSATEWRVDCPACGSIDVRIAGGDELELTQLTLEDVDGDPGPA